MYDPEKIIPIAEDLDLDGHHHPVEFKKTFYPKFALPWPTDEDSPFPVRVMIWQGEKPYVGYIDNTVCGPQEERFLGLFEERQQGFRNPTWIFGHSPSNTVYIGIVFKDDAGTRIAITSDLTGLLVSVYVIKGELVIEGKMPVAKGRQIT